MNSTFPIVALACSTGGVDALIQVLAPLPAGFPAAVIAVQHLQPQYPSDLPERLGQRIALPVLPATDGAVLRPGLVLVGPPGRHVLAAAADTLLVIPAGSEPAYRPSADLLLTSLAITTGPRVIAVILSGQGHDGATGATAVHRLGGRVIVSNPLSAIAAAMPQATINRPGITDHVLPVDAIAELLTTLTQHPDDAVFSPAHGPRDGH